MTADGPTLMTILVTDLVSSTPMLERAGDERGQRIFQAHHRLLKDAVSANGGHEPTWLGDGILAAFDSTADAVRCAIAVQQASRRPVDGERLAIRAALHAGEVSFAGDEVFGEAVAAAEALCGETGQGQIACSSFVAELLRGRQAFEFQSRGELAVAGHAEPIAVYEVLYEVDRPAALLNNPPFVGRDQETTQLLGLLREVHAGNGKLAMLVGEPGLGKTRLALQVMDIARSEGCITLQGRCYEGDWTPPYGPFVEALTDYVERAGENELREHLAYTAPPLSRLVPRLRERLSDLEEPVALSPSEERLRILDAVAQLLRSLAGEATVVLLLDDVHWADRDTIAMLRHASRVVAQSRILVLCTYRDAELDRQHPLAEALAAFRREPFFRRLALEGLGGREVGLLLASLSDEPAPGPFVQALLAETGGNPLFLRETLLHLLEETEILVDGRWRADLPDLAALAIPEGVREVIGRRLSRLSGDANAWLRAAAGFSASFPFEVVARVADLDQGRALDVLDEALDGQLLRPTQQPEQYVFSHALIRSTLIAEMNPSRQVRLHRQIAEAIQQVYEDDLAARAPELAYQYHQSAALPGSEYGVEYAIIAANRAQDSYAYDDAVTFLRIALDLLPSPDTRRAELTSRLALALAWTLSFDEAVATAVEGSELIAASYGNAAAADYLAEAARTLQTAGNLTAAWSLAEKGIGAAGETRNTSWAWLTYFDILRREAQDAQYPGIPLDSPERRELAAVTKRLPPGDVPRVDMDFNSRADVLAKASDDPLFLTYVAGEFRRSTDILTERAPQREREGRIAAAVGDWSLLARCLNALGDLSGAHLAHGRAVAMADRLSGPSPQTLQLLSTRLELSFTVDPRNQGPLAAAEPLLAQPTAAYAYAAAPVRAVGALGYAWLDREEDALRLVDTLIEPLVRAPRWASYYHLMVYLVAYALWVLGRTDHADVVERETREKVLAPDFRFPMTDSRLSMARLSALQHRWDEAAEWFAKARLVLEEQGALPLRAIVDLDEGEMYLRRGDAEGRRLAQSLLGAAEQRFASIGMAGWEMHAQQVRANSVAR